MEANLKSRLATASVGIPLLIFVVGWGQPWLFLSAVVLLTLAALHEYFIIVFRGRVRDQLLGVSFGIALASLIVAPDAMLEIGLGLLLTLLFSVFLFMGGELDERLTRIAWTLLGAFYLGYLLPHWMLLFRLPQGRAWVFFVLSVIMVGDTMAYFIGKRMGTKKLAPRISPGKTVEGALASVVGSMVTGGLAGMLLMTGVSLSEALMLAAILSVLGQIGDLFESCIKRAFGTKDSGTMLPGHGGVMDRIDSLIFPAAFTTAYLKVFH